jgi:hypothetical protein
MSDPESVYMTLVGGTQLMTDPNKNWLSETTWNDVFPQLRGKKGAGGGGSIDPANSTSGLGVALPNYQTLIAGQITAAGGNSLWRAVPDVAMTATDIGIYYNGSLNFASGTSASAPLWAAFAALVNEQSAQQGLVGPLGFANPALYAAGESSNYLLMFHDIQAGTNIEGPCSGTPASCKYSAVAGYDLVTGWGTPASPLLEFLGCPVFCGGGTPGCVNLATDPKNCGTCGNSCGSTFQGVGPSCVAGVCQNVDLGITALPSVPVLCFIGVGLTPFHSIEMSYSNLPAGNTSTTSCTATVDENGQFACNDLTQAYSAGCTGDELDGAAQVSIDVVDLTTSQSIGAPILVPAEYWCSQVAHTLQEFGPGGLFCTTPDEGG